MNAKIGNLLALVALLVGLAATSQAHAQRAKKPKVNKTNKKGRVAIILPSRTQVFNGVTHKAVVTALKTHMLAAQNGTNGSYGAGYQALVVSLPGKGQIKTTKNGKYDKKGTDTHQELQLKGAGEITHMGTTSTHDFAKLGSKFGAALKQRIAGNTTFVTVNGKSVINGLKVDLSGISQHKITLPKGKLKLEFARGFGGRKFGPSGYIMGRRLMIDNQ